MCGILGFVSKNGMDNNKANQLIINGYYSQIERGRQSFGAVAGSDKKVVTKSTKSIVDFITRFAKNKLLSANPINTLIFHHRMASVGTVSKQNTHPFVAGNICLVHNGTWSNASLFKGDFKGKLQGETDSEIIAHLLNEQGIKGLKDIDGSASLVWLNKEENTLNFWRRRTPMVLGYVKDLTILLFASTLKAISSMIDVLGIKRIEGVFLPIFLEETSENVHYKCSFEGNLKIEKKMVKTKPSKVNTFDYNYNGFLYNQDWSQTQNRKNRKTSVYPQNQDLFSYEDRDWDDDPYDFLNKKLKK